MEDTYITINNINDINNFNKFLKDHIIYNMNLSYQQRYNIILDLIMNNKLKGIFIIYVYEIDHYTMKEIIDFILKMEINIIDNAITQIINAVHKDKFIYSYIKYKLSLNNKYSKILNKINTLFYSTQTDSHDLYFNVLESIV